MRVPRLLLAVLLAGLCSAPLFASGINLVQDGTFAQCSGNTVYGNANCTYWTITPGSPIPGITELQFPGNLAEFGGWSYDAVSQGITTTAGAYYTLTFSLQDFIVTGTPPADFRVLWDGTLVLDIPGGVNPNVWQSFTLYLPGTGSDTLKFEGYEPPGAWELTNVSLVEGTPEPATLLLFGTGLAGMVGAVRRKFAR